MQSKQAAVTFEQIDALQTAMGYICWGKRKYRLGGAACKDTGVRLLAVPAGIISTRRQAAEAERRRGEDAEDVSSAHMAEAVSQASLLHVHCCMLLLVSRRLPEGCTRVLPLSRCTEADCCPKAAGAHAQVATAPV